MKKSIQFLGLLSVVSLFIVACDKETIVNADGLPATAQTYINQHFPSNEVLQVVKERDDLTVSYDVYLSEGYHLEFNKKGEIQGVEGNNKLPDSVVPAKILTYVKANYPDQFIVDWELEDRGQEVKLNNRLELVFDKSGNFLRLDF